MAKRLEGYASSLNRNIYNKLNKYDGEWSNNLTTAESRISTKITALNDEAEKYSTYKTALSDLRDACEDADASARSKVSELTGTFKENNGIRNNVFINAIGYFSAWLGNTTVAGRWVEGGAERIGAGANYLKDSIEEWYDYGGGEEFLKGIAVGFLSVAIGVLSIVGAVVTGGAAIFVIAGVIGGIIAVANGVADIWNECEAFQMTQSGDPATGRRRSEVNTWQDYLRSSFLFGDDAQDYEYVAWANNLALGIDVVNIACIVVGAVSSIGKLVKNGYKWATGNPAKLSKIEFSKIFSKESLASFKTKFTEIGAAIKDRGWSYAKDVVTRWGKDFLPNLKNKYLNFETTKDGISSAKSILSVQKSLISDGLEIENIAKIAFFDFVMPGLTAFSVNNEKVENGLNGKYTIIVEDNITFDDVIDGFKKGAGIVEFIGEGMDFLPVRRNLKDKLEEMNDANISVPEIVMPDMNLDILRNADITVPRVPMPKVPVSRVPLTKIPMPKISIKCYAA